MIWMSFGTSHFLGKFKKDRTWARMTSQGFEGNEVTWITLGTNYFHSRF